MRPCYELDLGRSSSTSSSSMRRFVARAWPSCRSAEVACATSSASEIQRRPARQRAASPLCARERPQRAFWRQPPPPARECAPDPALKDGRADRRSPPSRIRLACCDRDCRDPDCRVPDYCVLVQSLPSPHSSSASSCASSRSTRCLTWSRSARNALNSLCSFSCSVDCDCACASACAARASMSACRDSA